MKTTYIIFDELGEADSLIDMTWSSQDEVKKQIPDSRQMAAAGMIHV